MISLTREDLSTIDDVVRTVGERLRYEDRFDLRQDLAIKLLNRGARPGDLRGWLRSCAHNWISDFWRVEYQHREMLRWARPTPYRKAPGCWAPAWYAPHAHAEEFAPLACEGARVIFCQGADG